MRTGRKSLNCKLASMKQKTLSKQGSTQKNTFYRRLVHNFLHSLV